MKTRKILLDVEDDNEELNIGLIRLAKAVPEHELYYEINRLNEFKFKRIADLVIHGTYFDYSFSRFQAYYSESKICLQCISNKSFEAHQKSAPPELFSGEDEVKILLEHYSDVDYLLKTSEPIDDFSVILHPENLMFQIQDFPLSPKEELYQIIQYYE
ncbi:IPExxxVDY family protein [Kaistella palustris]|uniref:IPExxxVDY family protein n=1 Tax=Kaistella palustris TaxID=493376 RepID=UPI0004806D3D|nr:IPExxxVDY family protein [Kaistella palustris]